LPTAPPADIDEYLAALDPGKRAALQALRETIRDVVPDAEETISYGMPGFRLGGDMVAGFAAAARHLGYYPHSGRVLDAVAAETPELLAGLTWSKGSLRLPLDRPVPRALVEALVAARLADIASGRGKR
jgi:uncharacterized protein YdhG (YjbR/CyaY superfamily)